MTTSRPLQVGDPVVMCNATYFEELDQAIGVIVGGLCQRRAIDLRTMETITIFAYRVQLSETFRVIATPLQVRPLREPDHAEGVGDERERVLVQVAG